MANIDFLPNHPLGFSIYYKNYQLKNTLYIDDGGKAEPLFLELFNASEHSISLEAPKEQKATEKNCHFMLRWHRNVLGRSDIKIEDFLKKIEDFLKPDPDKEFDGDKWQIKIQPDRNFITVYYLMTCERGAELYSGCKILFKFSKLTASHEYGAGTTQLELTYGPLMKNQSGQPLKTSGSYNSYTNIIELLHRGKPNIPLYAGFTDSHTILNDGVTPNTLILHITNTNKSVDLNSDLTLSKDSRFIISFETGPITKKWALVESDQAKQIHVNIASKNQNDWEVQAVNNSSTKIEWIVKPKRDKKEELIKKSLDAHDEIELEITNIVKRDKKEELIKKSLDAHDEIELEITNIVSRHPTGEANMYIRYENISDYANGTFVVPIGKTPLLYRGKSVGVYTVPHCDYTIHNFKYDFENDEISKNPKGFRLETLDKNNRSVEDSARQWQVVPGDKHHFLQAKGQEGDHVNLYLDNIHIISPGNLRFRYSKSTALENTLTLYQKAQSQSKYQEMQKISGSGSQSDSGVWYVETFKLQSGIYTFKWEYTKTKTSLGSRFWQDAWIDWIELTGIRKDFPSLYLFNPGTHFSSPSKNQLALYTQNKPRVLIDDDKDCLIIYDNLSISSREGDIITVKSRGEFRIESNNIHITSEELHHVDGRIKDKTGWVMPVGTILPYAGKTAPDGWLLCDGQAYNKNAENNKYFELFDVIKYTYKEPSESESGDLFRVPNLKGKVPVGHAGDGDKDFDPIGKSTGERTHTLTVAEMPSHTHGVNDPKHSHYLGGFTKGGGNPHPVEANKDLHESLSTSEEKTNISINPEGKDQAHNNLQPSLTVNFIIKY